MESLFSTLIVSIFLCANFNPPINNPYKPGIYCALPIKCPQGHKYYPGWCIRPLDKNLK